MSFKSLIGSKKLTKNNMAQKYKKALVTGGAGFIGSHVVDALIRRRIKVYIVDDLSTGAKVNINPNAHFTKLSINNPQFPNYLKRIKPDIIFHFAAQIDVRKAVDDPVKDAKVNIMGGLVMAHTAAKIGVKKLVFASTGGAMYPDSAKAPYSEKVAPEPISPYGIAKRASELYLHFAYLTHGMKYTVLRYANVYGPRQNPKAEAGVISIFGKNMMDDKPVSINGDGKQTRDFVYVDDVVRANMLAMRRSFVGILNIGTGKQTNINTIFKKVKKILKSDTPEKHVAASSGEVLRSALNAKKAKKILGWEAKVGLDEGLKKTLKWMKG
jgi:UDP-glucose 4-epimerase